MEKKIVYFLCTGNSCRSQMAEGFGSFILGDKCEVYSAGVRADGVNERAVRVMDELNIDISMQTSDMIDSEILHKADFVITLCGDAKDQCPPIPDGVIHEHWDIIDPALAKGSEEEVLDIFRYVRDEIEYRIKQFRVRYL